jgi:RIO kinase 1
VEFDREKALKFHALLLREVIIMLCAGVIHGDLSDYNILVDELGPVIIDLPQAIDAASSSVAASMLERDVTNLSNFFGTFAPELVGSRYGKEIWNLYEAGLLSPDSPLTGKVALPTKPVDVRGVIDEIELARQEEENRIRHQMSMQN